MATLTKADLVEAVATELDVSLTTADAIVETFIGSLVGALKKGERVEIRKFGTLRIRERKPRIAHNPKNPDERVAVPAKLVPYFKPGKELKASLITKTR